MNPYRKQGMLILLFLAVSLAGADTFKHLASGETFTGFRTHKKSGDKVLIFNAQLNKFLPLDLTEYQVTTNEEGRRDSVMIVKIDQPEILQSEAVSRVVSESILKTADQGPKALIIQIDSPGGQGPYMKMITEAISAAIETTGCRVVAYLPGDRYSGAYSAAAVVALACEQIYIAPTASIGAVGPMVTSAMSNEEYTRYLEAYSPDVLSTFSIYAASLAHKYNRPELLARALVDKQLAVAEVRNSDGKQSLVELSQRQEDQSVIRMVAEGLPASSTQYGTSEAVIRDYSKLLILSSTDAVRWKMADKQAPTIQDVLGDLGLDKAPTVTASGISNVIQKFATAQRNLNQLITKIELEEARVATLEEHLAEMEKIALTSPVTRELNSGGQYINIRRGSVRLRTVDRLREDYYNERDTRSGDIPLQDRYGREIRLRDQEGFTDRQQIISEQPSGNIQEVRMQILAVLNEMAGDYQRAIGLARRWPGALPLGVSVKTLQENLNSAQALFNSIQRRNIQGY